MKFFTAKSDKQLGICLRMLCEEKAEMKVRTVRNDQKKVEFHIIADDMDDEKYDRYQKRYETLIA